jgi:hypothetical protein
MLFEVCLISHSQLWLPRDDEHVLGVGVLGLLGEVE